MGTDKLFNKTLMANQHTTPKIDYTLIYKYNDDGLYMVHFGW